MKRLLNKIADALARLLYKIATLDERTETPSPAPTETPGESAQQDPEPTTPEPEPEKPAASVDAVPFADLDWCWGGFKGGKAAPVGGVEIKSLKVSRDGMSYSWARGGCENLGASSSTDASCVAALFCRIGGKWEGGKFDWISTSRRTRDFKNISEGYNGWDKQAVGKADKFAFVIVSKDGKKRTNVIAQGV